MFSNERKNENSNGNTWNGNSHGKNTFRAKFKGSSTLTQSWKEITLLVGISIGNPLLQNEKFEAFVDLVNVYGEEKKIKKLDILLTGYLHRHYVHLSWTESGSSAKASEEAKALDQEWLNQNKSYLKKLKIPFAIIHWEDQVLGNHKNFIGFDELYKSIKRDYEKDATFRSLVNDYVGEYIDRKIRKYVGESNPLDVVQLRESGLNYVLEECVAYIQIKYAGYDYLAYPGHMPHQGKHVLDKYFENDPLHYVRYVLMVKLPPRVLNVEENLETGIERPKSRKATQKFRTKVFAVLKSVPIQWDGDAEKRILEGIKSLLEEMAVSGSQSGN